LDRLNLILVFAVVLGLLPVAGYKPLSEGLWENVRYLLLPALTLGSTTPRCWPA
jgi:peptide/nickel transport system permease protein